MEVRIYRDNPMLHAGPAALSLSSEMDEAAHDHLLSIGGPVEHLLVATDFTERSNRAVARALERGNALRAQVTLLHVVEEGRPRKLTKLRQREARELLVEHARSWCPHTHNDISINVRTGEPYLEIIREAIELGSDAIILGLPGRGVVDNKDAATAIDVVRYSDKPVLMVALPPLGSYHCAVVDVGSCVPFGSAIRAARRLAPQADAQPVRVAPTAVAGFGISLANPFAASGNSTNSLVDYVSQIGADLLVVGSDRVFQHAHDDPSNLLRRASDAQRCDLLFVRTQ